MLSALLCCSLFFIVCMCGKWERMSWRVHVEFKDNSFESVLFLLYGSQESVKFDSHHLLFLRRVLPLNLEISVFARLSCK